MDITEIEERTAVEKINQNERLDGRDLEEFRDIKIETGVARKAEGSVKVTMGDTKVIVGVKFGVGDPFPDTPDEGILMVNAELGPMASPNFESGPPGKDATELARVVDRGIRESEALPLEELCIEEGEKVWKVMIDIHVLDHDGNLMDASALGAVKALLEAKMPGYDDGEIIREEERDFKLSEVPVACTVSKINGNYVIDPNLIEEEVADAMVTVTWTEDNLCSLQKRGEGGFEKEELLELFEMANEKTSELRELIK
ncbi:MAG: exosome complex protein Rrp42 [Candidatus Aenigmatarchaeota archaeon]